MAQVAGIGRGVRARRAVVAALVVALACALVATWAADGALAAAPKGKGKTAAALVARTTCSTAAYLDNTLLGPRRLPTAGPVASLLRGWKRLAGYSPRGYLRRFYDSAAKSWRYPPQGGYALTPLGAPISGEATLIVGQVVDRFGSEGGTYLAPAGTPYGARGIPPESLNPYPGGEPCNYYRYRVLKPFAVDAGPIAPALGQAGFGLQYVLSATHFPGVTERVNVTYLLTNGYVERVPYKTPKPAPAAARS